MGNIKKQAQETLPNRIKKFLSYRQYSIGDSIKNLESSDLKMIRQIASGKITGISRGDRVKTFRVMADLGRQQDFEIISRVLEDKEEEKTVRAVAALNLGFFPPKIAEKKLIGRLKIEDDLVRTKVIKSLGMIGEPDAYKALSLLKNIRTDFVKRQLIFAKTLVAYRHNLDADPMPFIEGAKRRRGSMDKLLSLTVKPSGSRRTKAALNCFKGSKYGIQLAQSIGFQVTAGKAKWMLFINKQPADDGIIKSINNRKMIMGLLSRWLEETKTYNTQYVVLTKPTEDNEVQVMVVRSDGEMFYSGKMKVKRNVLSFLISDIKRPGTAPTKVKGKLTLRGIELNVNVPFSQRKGKRSPRKIEAEEFFSKFSNSLR